MRKLVVLPLVLGLLLAGCAPIATVAKAQSEGLDRIPVWVDTIGIECGVVLSDGSLDAEAMCGIGDALYVGP